MNKNLSWMLQIRRFPFHDPLAQVQNSQINRFASAPVTYFHAHMHFWSPSLSSLNKPGIAYQVLIYMEK